LRTSAKNTQPCGRCSHHGAPLVSRNMNCYVIGSNQKKVHSLIRDFAGVRVASRYRVNHSFRRKIPIHREVNYHFYYPRTVERGRERVGETCSRSPANPPFLLPIEQRPEQRGEREIDVGSYSANIAPFLTALRN
jgi:hypothetical protein